MEIEKKYLLKRFPEEMQSCEKKVIEQGYLCTSPVVRIRKSNDRYILTYKAGKGGTQGICGNVRVNEEIEAALSQQGYEHLKKKIDGNLIQKTRYVLPLADGHRAEMDIFEGALKGLAFVEVEFQDEQDAASFLPPDWFGDNVSADHRYSNSFLSTCSDLSVFDK